MTTKTKRIVRTADDVLEYRVIRRVGSDETIIGRKNDPQVGVIDNLGRQFCMTHADYARGTARPIYFAHMLYEPSDTECDACHKTLIAS